MAERRRGGETGVTAMQALRGDAVWQALEAGQWQGGGWDAGLFEACLSRSHTLAQPETFSHRYPTAVQIREWSRIRWPIGSSTQTELKATMIIDERASGGFYFRRPA